MPSNKRRFHITEEEGQVVRLALQALLDRIYPERDPFYQWLKIKAEDLKVRLTTYRWYKDQ